jgi:hypothetical protein
MIVSVPTASRSESGMITPGQTRSASSAISRSRRTAGAAAVRRPTRRCLPFEAQTEIEQGCEAQLVEG